MVNNPELINKMINNINKLDDETIKEAIQEVENEDMEEDIKNDLAGIAFSHPFFSDIVTEVLNHIKELEAEVESQDKTIDKLVEEQEEREKYTHSLEEENKRLNENNINMQKELFVNSIPISVIQNEIDELDKNIEEVKVNIENSTDEERKYWKKVKHDLIMQRNILKEILEKGNK